MLKFYLTRDSDGEYAKLYPEEIGIIKRKGCFYYQEATGDLCHQTQYCFVPMEIPLTLCKAMFGFIPEVGKAYYVRLGKKGRLVATEVRLAFSEASEALDAYPWRLTDAEIEKYLD